MRINKGSSMNDQETRDYSELMRQALAECPEAVPCMWPALRDYLISKNASSPVPAFPCAPVRRMK
jgi:hypothetical protein